ncbi:MAG: hypothetical protein ACKO7R_09525, partial [Pseudanabaena sp.]
MARYSTIDKSIIFRILSDKLLMMREDWIEVELGDVCDVNPKKPIVDDECEVSFIPMAQVEEETGIYHLKETRKYKDVKKGY